MKISLVQILTVGAALVFLVGGIFMLINVFAGYRWGFWVGLGLALVACALAGIAYFENKRTVTSAVPEGNDADEKIEE